MARIKVKGYDTIYAPGRGCVSFALCSSPKNGREQCMRFESCKAFLQDMIFDYMDKEDDMAYDERVYNIDMNKLRLLVTDGSDEVDEDFKRRLYGAKKVVNFYEKIAGWPPSKIARVDHTHYKSVWLITGPKGWMSAPQLISMVTLVLRSVTENGPIEFKNNEDLEKLYKSWADERKGVDSSYLAFCWNKLHLVMKHYKELFEGFSPIDLHANGPVDSHSNGIVYMCQFRSATKKLNERFRKLCEKKIGKEKKDVDLG